MKCQAGRRPALSRLVQLSRRDNVSWHAGSKKGLGDGWQLKHRLVQQSMGSLLQWSDWLFYPLGFGVLQSNYGIHLSRKQLGKGQSHQPKMHMTGDRPDISPRQTAGCILISVTLTLIHGNFTDIFRIDSRFTQKQINSEYGYTGFSYQVDREGFYKENPLLVCQNFTHGLTVQPR